MLTSDPHQGNTVLQMRAQELPAGEGLAPLGPGQGQRHMRISGTTGIECHIRSITPMTGAALANMSPFHNLGSGTGSPGVPGLTPEPPAGRSGSRSARCVPQ